MSHINFQLLFTSAIYVNFYALTNNDVKGSGISQIMTDRLFGVKIYALHVYGNVVERKPDTVSSIMSSELLLKHD